MNGLEKREERERGWQERGGVSFCWSFLLLRDFESVYASKYAYKHTRNDALTLWRARRRSWAREKKARREERGRP